MNTITEYEKGFVEGLQAVCLMGEAKSKLHSENSEKLAGTDDREQALNCAIVLGFLVSDIKCLGATVFRKEIDVKKIAQANKNFWWATEDGKGRN